MKPGPIAGNAAVDQAAIFFSTTKRTQATSSSYNAANEAGDTALFGAVSKGFRTVVKFLAENRARLDVKDKLGTTLLMLTSPRATATRTSGTPASMFETTAALLRELGVKE